MSAGYHTPLTFAASLNAATLNAPLGELDAALYAIVSGGAEWPLLATPLTPPVGTVRWFINESGQFTVLNAAGQETSFSMGTIDSYAAFTNIATPEVVASAGTWLTRALNTTIYNGDGIASLASNQITLEAGTYITRITAPAFDTDEHQIRLRDITHAETLLIGSNAYAKNGKNQFSHSILIGQFTLNAAAALEVQHYVQTKGLHTSFSIGAGVLLPNQLTTLEVWV